MIWQTILAVIGVIGCALIIAEGFYRYRVNTFFTNLSDEGRDAEEQWRSHIVNDYITLLAYVSGESADVLAKSLEEKPSGEDDVGSNCSLNITPTVWDESIVTFYYYDGILTARFDWRRGKIHLKVSIINDNEKYKRRKSFAVSNQALPYDDMLKWIEPAVEDMAGGFGEEELLAILTLSKKFIGAQETEEEKKVRFNTMLDFAVIMSKNKMLRNKSMRKVYGQVIKMLMIYQGEEFIKYVKELSGIKEGVSQKD